MNPSITTLQFLLLLISLACCCHASLPTPSTSSTSTTAAFPWFDPTLPVAQRVSALITALSLDEKVAQLTGDNNAVPRLGLPSFAWCSEGSHGVARAGRATVFPSPIALGATFDAALVYEAGRVLADEARAKNNVYEAGHRNDSAIWYGVNFFAPNINLFTHTRWGRGQETFTEDPYLSSRLAVAYVRGMQNDWGVANATTRYVQASATCKHFFAYGSSNQTQLNDLWVHPTHLLQTYLPSFDACIREAKARSVMCSYSTINGHQMCQHPLLQRILRDEWRFDGFVTADDGAISLGAGANVTYKAAAALNAGCDMGGEFSHLGEALQLGLIKEQEIDVALNRSLTLRVQLGKFDPPALVPWSGYNLSHVDTHSSRQLARRAALESTVLLQNKDDLLPLSLSPAAPFSRSKRAAAPLKRIAVIGPNADRRLTLLGNYCGCQDGQPGGPLDPPITPGCTLVTPLQAIRAKVDAENSRRRATRGGQHRHTAAAAAAGIEVVYNKGADINSSDTSNFTAALALAQSSDVVIAVMGIGTCVGPWSGLPADCIEAEAHDRTELGLTGVQPQLLHKLIAAGTPVVLVLMSGSPLLLTEYVGFANLHAVLQHWYSGEEGGNALADILFGHYSPSGRLPVTFPYQASDVPADDSDYNMTASATSSGRTYRYSTARPLYAFGYGLGYSAVYYDKSPAAPLLAPLYVNATAEPHAVLTVTARVNNDQYTFDAAEVAQVYVSYQPYQPVAPVQFIPRTELKAFKRVAVPAANSTDVVFHVPLQSLRLVGPSGALEVLPGLYTVQVGGAAPGSRGVAVDGDDDHAGPVTVDMPDGVLSGAACEGAVRLWKERVAEVADAERAAADAVQERGSQQDGTAVVNVPFAVKGGLTAILTVC